MIRGHLEQDPDLASVWQNYSYDKRGTPSPFLDGLQVGFADVGGTIRGVRSYPSSVEACAQFILAEAAWVLERREPIQP